jgi:hypothetical protein
VDNPVDERLNTAGILDALNISNAGVGMPQESLGDLEKKVERLGEGLDALRGEVHEQSASAQPSERR